MKVKAANFAADLCEVHKSKCGGAMRKVVESLTENLKHQHSKVRKQTLKSLQQVIVSHGAEEFLTDSIQQIKMTSNDRSQDVRMIVIQMVEFWLQNMDINALKKYEKDLTLILLNGISEDQLLDISVKSSSVLETHGVHMKEALIALGDEEETPQESTPDSDKMTDN